MGLRDASLAWLQLLTFTVEHVGLWSDSLEPCVYGGQIVKDGHELGFCMNLDFACVWCTLMTSCCCRPLSKPRNMWLQLCRL